MKTLAALLMFGAFAWAGGTVRLKGGTADPARAREERVTHPGRHWLVQFASFPGPREIAELERRGIRVLAYVPDSGLMLATSGKPDLRGFQVVWAGALDAAVKLSPQLEHEPAGVYLIEFHRDVDAVTARGIAGDLGFRAEAVPGLAPWHVLATGDPEGLQGLAARDEVAYILPAPLRLLTRRRIYACSGPITAAGPVADYALADTGWPQENGMAALSYFFETLPANLDQNAARSAIERAFAEWARYANIAITAGQQAEAARAIDIVFAGGAHGDAYPFTSSTQLAHTFYPAPPNPEPVAGDMHFNNAEAWNLGSDIDLFSVALHETGHALGLGHSDNPNAVMYPYYKMASGLTDDDIAGIQALYGPPRASQPAMPVTPGAPAQPTPPAEPTPPVQPSQPTQPAPSGGDAIPPTLTIVSPGLTIVSTTAASLSVSGTASDNVGVTAVRWSTSTGGSGTAAGTVSWSAQVPLLVGTNVVTVRAYDAAGNAGWRAITVVRN